MDEEMAEGGNDTVRFHGDRGASGPSPFGDVVCVRSVYCRNMHLRGKRMQVVH